MHGNCFNVENFWKIGIMKCENITHMWKKHNMEMWKMKPYKYDRLYI
jgi:hypothetical protein